MVYKLYQYKALKIGFVVLCPNQNLGHLKNTINSINEHYKDASIVSVLPDECTSPFPKAIKGGKTLQSLLNAGLHASPCKDWNFVILTRGWLNNKLDVKYSYFVETVNDVLYPVINKVANFIDAEVNGLFINKKKFIEVGDFKDTANFIQSKLLWAEAALKKGCKFKGIVGTKIF